MYLKKASGASSLILLPALIVIFLGILLSNMFDFSDRINQISNPFTHKITITSVVDNPSETIKEELKNSHEIDAFKLSQQRGHEHEYYIKTENITLDKLFSETSGLMIKDMEVIEPFSHILLNVAKYFFYLFGALLIILILVATHHFLTHNLRTFQTVLLLGSTKLHLIKKVKWYFLRQYFFGVLVGTIILLNILAFARNGYISKQQLLSFLYEFSSIAIFGIMPVIVFILSAIVSIITINRLVYKIK
ncbi:MAG: hypothetical protein H6850_03520 [Alphaproteobacteria bacterium]|nr:MAG: hypothetical protein H6850_03520 [Alphaproteobacteria bacterium]